jgi:hypothetical protein
VEKQPSQPSQPITRAAVPLHTAPWALETRGQLATPHA